MSARAAFFDGLTTPSAPSLLGALLTAVAVACAVAFGVGDGALASGVPVADQDDEYAWLAARALRARAAPPAAPATWVLGSSALREGLTDERGLQEELGGAGSATVLTAGGLYPQEMLRLLDHLPVRPGDRVALEISPRNLGLAPEGRRGLLRDPRLPLQSPALDAAARGLGDTPPHGVAGSSVLSFPAFWSPRLGTVVHGLTGPPDVAFHLADALVPPDPRQLDRLTQRLAAWGGGCDRLADDNLALYASLVEYIEGAGARAVLVMAPRNRALVRAVAMRWPEAAAQRRACEARIGRWADDAGLDLLTPTDDADIPGAAFIDHAHIVDDGARQAFTRALARGLREAR